MLNPPLPARDAQEVSGGRVQARDVITEGHLALASEAAFDVDEQVLPLPMDHATHLSTSFALTGTSLDAHLTELRCDVFTKAGATPINEQPRLKHRQRVTIAGLIVAQQHPPTAKGLPALPSKIRAAWSTSSLRRISMHVIGLRCKGHLY